MTDQLVSQFNTWVKNTSGGPVSADPTAIGGPNVIAGVAPTWLRSDACPAIQLGTNAQKGLVQVDGTTITAAAGIISATAAGANPTATAGPAAINGVAGTFMRSDGAPAIQLGTNAQKGIVQVDGTTIIAAAGVISAVVPVGANPTATAGPAAINGVAGTFMRSDAAPAIQLGSAAQKGIVQVDNVTITAVGGVISAVGGGPSGANPTATAGPAAINGVAGTFMRSDAAPAIQLGTNAQKGLLQVDGTTIVAASGIISATASTPITAGTTPTTGFAVGDLIVNDTGNVVNPIADVAVHQLLASGGVGAKPAYTATPTITSVTFGSGTAVNDYEEGTWTPADGSGAGLSLTVTKAVYQKLNRTVTVQFSVTYPSTASGAQAAINGLPFTLGNSSNNAMSFLTLYGTTPSKSPSYALITTIIFYSDLGSTILANSVLATHAIQGCFTYTYNL